MTTEAYRVEKVKDIGSTACACSTCNWRGAATLVKDVNRCSLTPGDASPAGRCPKCENLAYPDTELHRAQANAEGLEVVLRRLIELDRKLRNGKPGNPSEYEAVLKSGTTLLRKIRGRKRSEADKAAGAAAGVSADQ